MFRDYKDLGIYKAISNAKVFSIISLIASVIVFIVECINGLNKGLMFYTCLFLVPVNCFLSIPALTPYEKMKLKDEGKGRDVHFIENPVRHNETKSNNDYRALLQIILWTLLPYYYLLVLIILGSFSGYSDFASQDILSWAGNCGALLISHSFVYIADIFLLGACGKIKEDWKRSPPEFQKAQSNLKKEEEYKRDLEKKKEKSTQLINKSGVKFFIKYYKQIKSLPMRDVNVVENYSLEEKEERILSVKRIIDENLSEFTLNEILQTYDNILTDDEKNLVQLLLNEKCDMNTKLKYCPECGRNRIAIEETMCANCIEKKKVEEMRSPVGAIKTNTPYLVRGRVYGTKAKEIYAELCYVRGWDRSKEGQFGMFKPLYSENCDTNRENDVWFICYPNYSKDGLMNVVPDVHAINIIEDNGDKITEIVAQRIGMSHIANRITFVKTKDGYAFLGVYKIVQNGTTRIYKRISDQYPM